ncbi:MAG: MlaE family ABC transporter permease [Gammaproteobacteria bacterium]
MTTADNNNTAAPLLKSAEADGKLLITVGGNWSIGGAMPDRTAIEERLTTPTNLNTLHLSASDLGDWDSSLLMTLTEFRSQAELQKLKVDQTSLPEGLQSLIDLAFAVEEREGARRTQTRESFLEKLGNATLDTWKALTELNAFTGELLLSIKRVLTGKAVIQRSQVWLAIQEAGAEALPIVGLISVLIGMIFAFVGVMQLSNFGAGIYTADLVAVAMLREMAPIMTGILMAGRTGASYAAQLGTMKVNEEIDALTTLGINPMDYLVLPKFMALVIMMPFLTLYSGLLGIIGGLIVALFMLDVSLTQYVIQTNESFSASTLFGGLFKSIVYGGLVALAGTQQGIACGNSAMAVGVATTRAVVTGIVLIVVSASILTVIYVNIGI